jgi:hypothetical protein
VAAENRLAAEQLAALAPGDVVTIESGAEFSRRRCTAGTVIRVTARHIVIRCGRYLEQYRLRDGVRVGGVGTAELVTPDGGEPLTSEARRRTQRIEAAYREWTRNRADSDRLRRVQEAISERLAEGHV